jgi:hypothetical protein
MMEGPGADSEEKHEPASDINTVVVDSLKRLTRNGRLEKQTCVPQQCLIERIERRQCWQQPLEQFLGQHPSLRPPGLSGPDVNCVSRAPVRALVRPPPALPFPFPRLISRETALK